MTTTNSVTLVADDGFSISTYMCWVEKMAKAYAREAVIVSSDEYSDLYDSAYYEFMAIENSVE